MEGDSKLTASVHLCDFLTAKPLKNITTRVLHFSIADYRKEKLVAQSSSNPSRNVRRHKTPFGQQNNRMKADFVFAGSKGFPPVDSASEHSAELFYCTG
jgi:hypothetical protein